MDSNPKAMNCNVKGYGTSDFNNVQGHNLRTSHTQSAEHLDPARLHLNSYHVLQDYNPRDQVLADIASNPSRKRGVRKNAMLLADAVVSFGSDIQHHFDNLSPSDQDELIKRFCIEVVEPHFNNRVFSFQTHRDETNNHCHFQMSRYTTAGNPCLFSRQHMTGFQTKLADFFHDNLSDEIERGNSKELTGAQHQKAGTYDQKNDDALERLYIQLSVNQERAKKARAKSDQAPDNAKLKKRAETYDKRAQNVQDDIDLITGAQSLKEREEALKRDQEAVDRRNERADAKDLKLKQIEMRLKEKFEHFANITSEDEVIRVEQEATRKLTEEAKADREVARKEKADAQEYKMRNERNFEMHQRNALENGNLKFEIKNFTAEAKELKEEMRDVKAELSVVRAALQELKSKFEHWIGKLKQFLSPANYHDFELGLAKKEESQNQPKIDRGFSPN